MRAAIEEEGRGRSREYRVSNAIAQEAGSRRSQVAFRPWSKCSEQCRDAARCSSIIARGVRAERITFPAILPMIYARGAVIGFGSASGAFYTRYKISRSQGNLYFGGVERAGSVSAAATEFQKSALRRALESREAEEARRGLSRRNFRRNSESN